MDDLSIGGTLGLFLGAAIGYVIGKQERKVKHEPRRSDKTGS
jgi:hypothetical protein